MSQTHVQRFGELSKELAEIRERTTSRGDTLTVGLVVKQQGVLANFLHQHCEVEADKWLSSALLWEVYEDWCDENQSRVRLCRNAFSREVLSTPEVDGDVRRVNGKQIRGFAGIGLRSVPLESQPQQETQVGVRIAPQNQKPVCLHGDEITQLKDFLNAHFKGEEL